MATFLVTGASSGIGEASALRLDRLGHRVYAGVRSSKDGERLQAVASPQLRPVMADVTDPDQIGATMAIIDDEVGPAGLDGLVNNAVEARYRGHRAIAARGVEALAHPGVGGGPRRRAHADLG